MIYVIVPMLFRRFRIIFTITFCTLQLLEICCLTLLLGKPCITKNRRGSQQLPAVQTSITWFPFQYRSCVFFVQNEAQRLQKAAHNGGVLLARCQSFMFGELAPHFVSRWTPAASICLADHWDEGYTILLTGNCCVEMGPLKIFIYFGRDRPIYGRPTDHVTTETACDSEVQSRWGTPPPPRQVDVSRSAVVAGVSP